jgi:hypothetical protein
MMKIINSLIVAGLLTGTALAGDGSFYVIDLSKPNGITYVQKQGNRYYYSSDQSDAVMERIRSNRERRAERREAQNRELLGSLLD